MLATVRDANLTGIVKDCCEMRSDGKMAMSNVLTSMEMTVTGGVEVFDW